MAPPTSAARGALTTYAPTNGREVKVASARDEEEEETPCSRALARLEPLQPILRGLAHRNHNQHRRATWWRCFGMLRRNCDKLIEELVSAIAAARANAAKAARLAKSTSKKRRREGLLASGSRAGAKDDGGGERGKGRGTESGVGIGRDRETGANAARLAAWLRDALVPKCYLAFSQLTADIQFAPLGVVLLGILAQVQAACDCVAPTPRPLSTSEASIEPKLSGFTGPEARKITEAGNIAPAASELKIKDAKQAALEVGRSGGGGKAVSRETVARAEKFRKEKAEEADQNPPHHRPPFAQSTQTKQLGPQMALSAAGVGRDTGEPSESARMTTTTSRIAATPLANTKQTPPTEGIKDEDVRPAKKLKKATAVIKKDKDKKTKKAKIGDEFDDLFKDLF
ncbi:hypothetical protein F5Y19DRAFT_114618 [Xylariaceae sp. FL1651]|nr:hypothetical protein F5Y19DRAFT_114618 [Xylariaceae sp. FL1651]